MPGMAFTGGTMNVSSYAAQDERTGSGPVGSFSANGTRTAALDITSDGAHIIDPGCNCGQAMNTNADMTAELKVMTSNFGADEAKGPVVISAIGKSGGQQFHGEAYAYARSWHLNANDPQNIDAGFSRPESKYFYPGFNIGGPLIIPGTNFNHNRDKLFFFFGTEDYNLSESLKLYVSYNHQHDNALNSLDVLWGPGGTNTWAAPTTPYPTPLVASSQSDVVTANLTKVINPTLTNEVVFSYTYLNLPNSFKDPTKVERGSLGLNYGLLFSHPNQQNLIFPQMTGWGDGISNMLNTGFELNCSVYAKKTLPSVADNLVKVWRTHTTKFGFYWERTWNEQPGNGAVNGSMVFSNWGSNGTGNAYADMLIGQTTQYSELNFDVVPAFRFISAEFYGTDSWKISRRLTLDYGMRVSHLGPWVDTTGYGFAAWYPNLYSNGTGGSVNGATFPGIQWNKVNASTPLSGSGSRAFFYNPRVGFAWDVFGSGRTVLRGGYGMYHFHDEQNVQNGAYSIVRGSFNSPTLWSPTIASLGPSLATLSAPSGVTALDPTDDQEPRTQSYSFTVAERLPWKSVLEVAYVGSKSDYLSNYNNNFDQLNDLGVGTLFSAYGWLPNCDSSIPAGQTNAQGTKSCYSTGADTGYSTSAVQNVRPLQSGPCVAAKNCLGTVKLIDHKMYSNYNSLQVTWNKQAGHFTFLTNYTFAKALGIRSENGDGNQGADPTNLRSNYGTLPNNRTHIFNFAYVYEFPTVHNANRFVKGAANGWQISGITQYQSGADLVLGNARD